MTRWLIAFLMLLAGWGLVGEQNAWAGGPSFAYVDVPRAMASCDAATKAREVLKKKLEVKQQEVDRKEAEIKRMKANLEQRQGVMNPQAQAEAQDQIRLEYREYQRLVEDNQAAIDRANSAMTKRITIALKEVIEEIGRERGYTAIFGKGQVLFHNDAIDITDLVLQRLNKKTKQWNWSDVQ